MNIFLPYAQDVEKSIESLDNKRLVKQILETKVLIGGATAYKEGRVPNSYFRHPVAQFYKDNPNFLAYYGLFCCTEYEDRFKKSHALESYFSECCNKYIELKQSGTNWTSEVCFIPYYMEGSKTSTDCIRTTDPELVEKLFKQKLVRKWEDDKLKGRPAKWAGREIPEFYKEYLDLSDELKQDYWQWAEITKQEARKGDA